MQLLVISPAPQGSGEMGDAWRVHRAPALPRDYAITLSFSSDTYLDRSCSSWRNGRSRFFLLSSLDLGCVSTATSRENASRATATEGPASGSPPSKAVASGG